MFDTSTYKNRRKKLADLIPNCAMLISSYPVAMRNPDVGHKFRQESSIVYFTGFEEEETVFLYRPGRTPETVLFVRPKDPLHELWEGVRFGVEGAKNHFGMDACFSIHDLDKHLSELLSPVEKLYYKFDTNPKTDTSVLNAVESARRARGRTGLGVVPIFDPTEVIGELRLFKDREEIAALQRACDISAEAHVEAMKFAKPGVSEKQVEAVMQYIFKARGSDRVGYDPIVGSGKNATTLHYNENKDTCKDFDLLLIDAGTECKYYTADITRTFPVAGVFTSAQKDFYNAVLTAQMDVLDMCKPGVKFIDLQEKARKSLSEQISKLGLIKERPEKIYEDKLYQKYYPHNIGHWLGLDVHDVGAYFLGGDSRELEPGMVFTVEPGLYVPIDDQDAPEEFRGMGVRIEDNVLITATGNKILSSGVPKTVDEIEEVMKLPSKFADL
ncbi:MAG: aminopeptidase P N-terminal domain-containing protein [Bdellovibrionales bacterium]|nr:aminopeptidase P N-terminal domain-containing protein [Bdellovibrionales bacterium]